MQPDILTKRDIIYRAGLFTILEVIFIALAARVFFNPIALRGAPLSTITFAEAKGGFTLLIIIWHALAVMSVKDIALFFFSSEWFSLYRQTGHLDSKSTDRVSKVTAGLIAQARHFTSSTATNIYKISLFLTFFLAAVGGLGPSAMFVNTMLVDTPTRISLANISFPNPPDHTLLFFFPSFRNYLLPYERANDFFRMETFENVNVGYNTLDNVMIPWPHVEPGFSSGKLVYSSDVMTFDHNCSWHEPVRPPGYVFLDQGALSEIAGTVLSWTLDDGREILTWTLDQARNLTSAFSRDKLDPLVGMLFFANDTNPGISVNLSGLPTFTFLSDPRSLTETTATVLLCNLNLTIHRAEVTLFNNTLNAHILPSRTKLVSNINPNPFFQLQFLRDLYNSLLFFFGDSQTLLSGLVNSITHFLFFCARNDRCEDHLRPLPLTTINDNMNHLVRVAAKGILDGFNGTKPGINTALVRGFDTFMTDAFRQEEKMVLVASGPILLALIVFVVLIEVILLGFLLLVNPTPLKSFNLENVAQLVHRKN